MAQHQMDILLRSEQVKDIANDINRHSDFDPPLLGNYLPSQSLQPLLPPDSQLCSILTTEISTTTSPKEFFTAALGESKEKRVEQLTTIAERISTAEYPSDVVDTLCSRQLSSLLDQNARPAPESDFRTRTAQRLSRLNGLRKDIKRKDRVAQRLWLVLLAHEIQYISQSDEIQDYTDKGVNSIAAAKRIAEKELDITSNDYKKRRNILKIMSEGGPASLLLDRDAPSSVWEKTMAIEDIPHIFAYIRTNILPLDEWIRSHNSVVSQEIIRKLEEIGWLFIDLLSSGTAVVATLKCYIPPETQHEGGPREPEPGERRSRVSQPPATLFKSNSISQVNSNRVYDNQISIASSSSSLDRRYWTKELTDPAARNLSCVNIPNENFEDYFFQTTELANLDYGYELTDLSAVTPL